MDYRIVTKGAFSIIGLHKQVRLQYEGTNPEITTQWESLSDEDYEALSKTSDVEPLGMLNATLSNGESNEEGALLDNYVGVASTQRSSDRWHVLPVAASTWVVFTIRGSFPQALQDTWARVYSDWLLTSRYEMAIGPHLVSMEEEDTESPDYTCELWIPIVKSPDR
jgi:AraC family transcriptional regulator